VRRARGRRREGDRGGLDRREGRTRRAAEGPGERRPHGRPAHQRRGRAVQPGRRDRRQRRERQRRAGVRAAAEPVREGRRRQGREGLQAGRAGGGRRELPEHQPAGALPLRRGGERLPRRPRRPHPPRQPQGSAPPRLRRRDRPVRRQLDDRHVRHPRQHGQQGTPGRLRRRGHDLEGDRQRPQRPELPAAHQLPDARRHGVRGAGAGRQDQARDRRAGELHPAGEDLRQDVRPEPGQHH
jgi:hypothetical protein